MSYPSERTIYLYKNYDRKNILAILGSNLSRHRQIAEAKEYSKRYDAIITGRNSLGGLEFEINPFSDNQVTIF
jgi:hypothetical protein